MVGAARRHGELVRDAGERHLDRARHRVLLGASHACRGSTARRSRSAGRRTERSPASAQSRQRLRRSRRRARRAVGSVGSPGSSSHSRRSDVRRGGRPERASRRGAGASVGSTSARRNRRWPPSVRSHGMRFSSVQRLSVVSPTPRRRAASASRSRSESRMGAVMGRTRRFGRLPRENRPKSAEISNHGAKIEHESSKRPNQPTGQGPEPCSRRGALAPVPSAPGHRADASAPRTRGGNPARLRRPAPGAAPEVFATMAHVVTERCVNCRYTYCAVECPVTLLLGDHEAASHARDRPRARASTARRACPRAP